MSDYYASNLSAERLERCYEIAPERVKRYLIQEIEYVLERIAPGDLVLELGCGYGRVLPVLSSRGRLVVGVDTSAASLRYAHKLLCTAANCLLVQADAAQLAFPDCTFDVVVCIQNGISAFHVNQEHLVKESVRVAKRGGTILFSSYSAKFWDHRLEWFCRQSSAGLLGEIDFEKTGDGVIVCKDGFTASTVSAEGFLELAAGCNVDTRVAEVDQSIVFCEMRRR